MKLALALALVLAGCGIADVEPCPQVVVMDFELLINPTHEEELERAREITALLVESGAFGDPPCDVLLVVNDAGETVATFLFPA
jgi:hypothetical protein